MIAMQLENEQDFESSLEPKNFLYFFPMYTFVEKYFCLQKKIITFKDLINISVLGRYEYGQE